MLDCLKPITHKRLIEHELEGFGIRLNKQPPPIHFKKKEKGGINFTSTQNDPLFDFDGAVDLFLTALRAVDLQDKLPPHFVMDVLSNTTCIRQRMCV